jgi:excisionase family DNA binding protein
MMQSTVPVRTPVRDRHQTLTPQAQQAQERKQALVNDPLMLLRAAVPLLGCPSYDTLRKWIANGSLRVWRVGRSHYRIRLSEIERFLASGNGANAEK